MVAFNFKPRFELLIVAGTKLQTIRATKRAKVGDPFQLYVGQRTPACRKILNPDPICDLVDYAYVRPDYLTLGDVRKHARNSDEFARRDGFADYGELVAWFNEEYGTPYFMGYVHGWKA